jgi:hypothetical protein
VDKGVEGKMLHAMDLLMLDLKFSTFDMRHVCLALFTIYLQNNQTFDLNSQDILDSLDDQTTLSLNLRHLMTSLLGPDFNP